MQVNGRRDVDAVLTTREIAKKHKPKGLKENKTFTGSKNSKAFKEYKSDVSRTESNPNKLYISSSFTRTRTLGDTSIFSKKNHSYYQNYEVLNKIKSSKNKLIFKPFSSNIFIPYTQQSCNNLIENNEFNRKISFPVFKHHYSEKGKNEIPYQLPAGIKKNITQRNVNLAEDISYDTISTIENKISTQKKADPRTSENNKKVELFYHNQRV